jgi:hypothetical protein
MKHKQYDLQRAFNSIALRSLFSMMAFSLLWPVYGTWADPPLQAMAVAHQSGKITGIYETTFQIDGKTYSLAPDAVILDRHGDPLQVRDLRVDTDVKYHLLKGTTDKIDYLILFLPY